MKFTAISIMFATAFVHGKQNIVADTDNEHAIKVMEGFVKVAIGADSDDPKNCLNDDALNGIVQNIIKAEANLDLITADNPNNKLITDGFGYLGDALKQTKHVLTNCSQRNMTADQMNAFDKIADLYINRQGLQVFRKTIKFNPTEITQFVKDALDAYGNSNFEGFGSKFGEAANKVFSNKALAAVMNKDNAAKVMEGILKSAKPDAKIEDLKNCVSNQDDLINDLTSAMNGLQTINNKLYTPALEKFGNTLDHTKNDLNNCNIQNSNFDHLGDLAQIFLNHQKYGINVIPNIKIKGVTIENEKNDAVNAYNNNDYYMIGQKIAEAAADVFNNANNVHIFQLMNDPMIQKGMLAEATKTMPKDVNGLEIAQVVQGFFQASNLQFNLGNLLASAQVVDDYALELYQASLLFEEAQNNTNYSQKLIKTLGGLSFSFMAVDKFLKKGLPGYEVIDTSNANFSKIKLAFQNIKKREILFKMAGEDVVFNGYKVTSEVIDAGEAFINGNYSLFGHRMGEIVVRASAKEDDLFLY